VICSFYNCDMTCEYLDGGRLQTETCRTIA